MNSATATTKNIFPPQQKRNIKHTLHKRSVQPEDKIDISFITSNPGLLKKHVEGIKDKVWRQIELSLNIPQLSDVYDLEEKKKQLVVAKEWWIENVTVNLPYNKMPEVTRDRCEMIHKTIQLVHEMWMKISIILIKWNPSSGRWETWISSYDYTQEVMNMLINRGLEKEVWVFSGLYPTDLAGVYDLIRTYYTWTFNEKQTNDHLSAQIKKAKKFSKDFPYLNGFVTQIVNDPIFAANFTNEIMKVAPGKELYIWTSSTSYQYHLKVIRTQIAKIIGDEEFLNIGSETELLKRIAFQFDIKKYTKIFWEINEPVNIDMLIRMMSSTAINSNVIAEIYNILWNEGIAPNNVHYHMNIYDSTPEESWINAKWSIESREKAIKKNAGMESPIIFPFSSAIKRKDQIYRNNFGLLPGIDMVPTQLKFRFENRLENKSN